MLVVMATASKIQAEFLKGFAHKHIAFQAGMDATINVRISPISPHGIETVIEQSSSHKAFQLSFHLPLLAWRTATQPPIPRKHRHRNNLTRLLSDKANTQTHLYEAQISCMITGVDGKCWTAFSFVDTYHDEDQDGERRSQRDVGVIERGDRGQVHGEVEEEDKDGHVDPLIRRCERDGDGKRQQVLTPRDYFLRALLRAVCDARGEWEGSVRSLLGVLGRFVSISFSFLLSFSPLLHPVAIWGRSKNPIKTNADIYTHTDKRGIPVPAPASTTKQGELPRPHIRADAALSECHYQVLESVQGDRSQLLLL